MRLSIKSTLIGLFSLFALVTVAQGLVTLGKLRAIGDRIEVVGGNALPSVDEAHAVSTLVMRSRLRQFRYLLADTEAERALAIKSFDSLAGEAKTGLKSYARLVSSPEEQAFYEGVQGKWRTM